MILTHYVPDSEDDVVLPHLQDNHHHTFGEHEHEMG